VVKGLKKLPVPKFEIGDPVYAARSDSKMGYENCPDCLGQVTWEVETPSGSKMKVVCRTCRNSGISNYGKVPSVVVPNPRVDKYTIGSVRIDSAAKFGERVSYMCNETGVGTGSVYYEATLFTDKGEADKKALEMSIDHADRINEHNKEMS
jgi:hypothetical protein